MAADSARNAAAPAASCSRAPHSSMARILLSDAKYVCHWANRATTVNGRSWPGRDYRAVLAGWSIAIEQQTHELPVVERLADANGLRLGAAHDETQRPIQLDRGFIGYEHGQIDAPHTVRLCVSDCLHHESPREATSPIAW